MPFPPKSPEYGDDFFSDTRMSFGDHIEELRTHLLRAIYGLLIVLVGGFVADSIGEGMGWKNFGLGKPMMRVIVDPVESMVRDFYAKRNERARAKIEEDAAKTRPDPAEVARIQKKLDDNGGSLLALTADERLVLRGAPVEMPVILPTEPLAKAFGLDKPPAQKEVEIKMLVYPTRLNYLSNRGELLSENKQYLTTLSVQEAFVVYFKVSLLCSFVLASPWVFYQLWSFVAAGLYPHERGYVYKFLGPSIFLFLSGVMLCQFVVLPRAVEALLAFNNWIELDPDLRLNEWLGFALLLPLVFGASFQTPLVMVFLNRIGMFTAADYWARWRMAVMVLALFAALFTPTPDAVTMLMLFIPMFGLYVLGILVCHYFPPEHEAAWKDEEQQVAV